MISMAWTEEIKLKETWKPGGNQSIPGRNLVQEVLPEVIRVQLKDVTISLNAVLIAKLESK